MSAIIKLPGDKVQVGGQSGLEKLEDFHRSLSNLDRGFGVVDIRAAYNSTPDTKRVKETIDAVRLRLESLTQKFKYQEEPDYRSNAIGFSSNGKMERADQKQRIGYTDLRKFLQYHEVALPLSDASFKIWQDLQINKKPGWFERITTRRKEIQPGNGLDMYVALCENVLRGIPAYGRDFAINPGRITYNGNLQALLNALNRDRLKGVIVETYPGDLRKYNLNATTWAVLLEMIGAWDVSLREPMGSGRHWYQNNAGENVLTNYVSASDAGSNIVHISSAKMLEKAGIAQLKFLFEITEPKAELSIDAQVSNREARYPTLAELLFYGLGHRYSTTFSEVEKRDCYYKIANEFNSKTYPENSCAYVCVDRRYYKDDKRSWTNLCFTSDIIGEKYTLRTRPISLYVL